MFNLNTWIDFDEVMPALLVNQELCRTRIAIAHGLGEPNCVIEDCLADLVWEIHCRRHFDDLLVAALHRAVALKQVHDVAKGVTNKLDFDMARAFEETLNENGSITESGLGFADRPREGVFELALLPYDTHTASTATHGSFDNYWMQSHIINA